MLVVTGRSEGTTSIKFTNVCLSISCSLSLSRFLAFWQTLALDSSSVMPHARYLKQLIAVRRLCRSPKSRVSAISDASRHLEYCHLRWFSAQTFQRFVHNHCKRFEFQPYEDIMSGNVMIADAKNWYAIAYSPSFVIWHDSENRSAHVSSSSMFSNIFVWLCVEMRLSKWLN